jgi:hypothetical protein
MYAYSNRSVVCRVKDAHARAEKNRTTEIIAGNYLAEESIEQEKFRTRDRRGSCARKKFE